MCGRYSFDAEIDLLIDAWKLQKQTILFDKKEEVRPTDTAPVLLSDGRLRLLRWGFQPHFAKGPLINARSETAAEKPSFMAAFERRRCIVPATGFFEWKDTGQEKKEKHCFRTADSFLALAGLWEVFVINETETPCFTILTTQATDQMDGIHYRMPVLLLPHERKEYLNHTEFTMQRWNEIQKQERVQLMHAKAL